MYHYRVPGSSIRVYDGDTLRADVDLGLYVWINAGGISFRLYGVDAPEMRGAELVAGRAARDELKRLLGGHDYVYFRTFKDKTEKYGRWLVTIFTNPADMEWERSINHALLNSTFGYKPMVFT